MTCVVEEFMHLRAGKHRRCALFCANEIDGQQRQQGGEQRSGQQFRDRNGGSRGVGIKGDITHGVTPLSILLLIESAGLTVTGTPGER